MRARTDFVSGSSRFASFAGALFFLAASAVSACSSVLGSAGSAGSDASCAAFTSCCTSVPGETAASCQATLEAARDSAGGVSCASLVQTYQESGYCGASDGGSAGGFDAGSIPCALTGTCDAGSSPTTGSGNSGSAGNTGSGTPQCQTIGTCANGGSYAACTQTSASGVCSASIVLSNGAQLACASCTDCAAASANAQAFCLSSSPSDDSGAPAAVDSGPSCGTPPALHPETAPGAYCPFTATGAIHCAAGQECCEVPAGSGQVSTCQAGGDVCPVANSIPWQCTDPIDCEGNPAGSVCCAAGSTTFDSVCSYDRGVSFTGSQCATICAAGQVQLCSAANDPCVSPQTCTPFKVAGLVLGTCLSAE